MSPSDRPKAFGYLTRVKLSEEGLDRRIMGKSLMAREDYRGTVVTKTAAVRGAGCERVKWDHLKDVSTIARRFLAEVKE